MQIGLLGPLEVTPDGPPLSRRDRVVLSALAVRPGHLLATDQLADALWRDEVPDSSTKVVQGCVVRLRKRLGPGAIETGTTGYRLCLTGLELDVRRFEELLGEAREQMARGFPERAVATLGRALALWRGRPFEDLEDWDQGRHEAARIEELRRTAQENLLDARVAAGDHNGVAADAVALVGEEPWRERRWATLALAQYRSGRQSDALRSIRGARRALGTQLGIDPGSELTRLEAAILAHDPKLAQHFDVLPALAEACPYKGLEAFDADDSDMFFGRDGEVLECLERLGSARLIALAGPSGSGKSSLLRAGIVPKLRREGRRVAVLVPGSDPAAAVSSALARVPGDAILAIDQFEEAFAPGVDPESRNAWLSYLLDYASEHAPIILTIRADCLGGLAATPSFARLAERGLHLVTPLVGDALRPCIEQPAAMAGLRIEPGLVDLLVRDTEDSPGALPLLSHVLAETWQRRDGRVLTIEGYLTTGGLRAAVARSADRLYESLPDEQRSLLRWLLLRLVSTSGDGEVVRSRVLTRSLVTNADQARLLDLLIRARLVTSEETSVELAHEALARAWPRLRSWLDDDAAGQRTWRHISTAAQGWEALGRPDSELYKGARLGVAVEWLAGPAPQLTRLERDFIEASQRHERSERVTLGRRAAEQARQNLRLRALLAGVAALLVIALTAGFQAVRSSHTAADERDAAAAATQSALHQALVNTSLALRSTNRGTAALLAVEAYGQRRDALARSALLGTFTASPNFLGYEQIPERLASFGAALNGAAIPGTSDAVVALTGRSLRILHTRTGRLTAPFPPPLPKSLHFSILKVSSDGRFVADVTFDGRMGPQCDSFEGLQKNDGRACTQLAVYSVSSGRRVFGPVSTPIQAGDVAINHDGTLVAVAGGFDGDAAIYDVHTGQLLARVSGYPRPPDVFLHRDTAAVTFGTDNALYLGSMRGPIRELDPRTMAVRRTFPAPLLSSHNTLMTTPGGTLIAGGDNAITSTRLRDGHRNWKADINDRLDPEPCPTLAVAPAVGRFYCGNFHGQIFERDLETGLPTGVTLDPQRGEVADLAVSANSTELMSFAFNSPEVSRWRLDGGGLVSRLVAPGRVATDGYGTNGDLLTSKRDLVGTPDEHVAVWDPAHPAATAILKNAAQASWAGSHTIWPHWVDGSSDLYDLDRHKRVPSPTGSAVIDDVWRSADQRWSFIATRSGNQPLARHQIRVYDAHSGKQVGTAINVKANGIGGVTATADLSHLFISYGIHNWRTVRMAAYDINSGQSVSKSVDGDTNLQVSPKGILVLAGYNGDITQIDMKTLRPIATFPAARDEADSLQFSSDGSVLAATSADQTVQLYDVATRVRLGDAIKTAAPNVVEGFLRPDGMKLAVNEPNGVVEWDIHPSHLAAAACTLAGRNLTHTEWETYFPGTRYHRTCPRFS